MLNSVMLNLDQSTIVYAKKIWMYELVQDLNLNNASPSQNFESRVSNVLYALLRTLKSKKENKLYRWTYPSLFPCHHQGSCRLSVVQTSSCRHRILSVSCLYPSSCWRSKGHSSCFLWYPQGMAISAALSLWLTMYVEDYPRVKAMPFCTASSF